MHIKRDTYTLTRQHMTDHLGPSIFNRDKGPSKDERIQALETEYAGLSKKIEFITSEHVDLLAKHAELQKTCNKTMRDLQSENMETESEIHRLQSILDKDLHVVELDHIHMLHDMKLAKEETLYLGCLTRKSQTDKKDIKKQLESLWRQVNDTGHVKRTARKDRQPLYTPPADAE